MVYKVSGGYWFTTIAKDLWHTRCIFGLKSAETSDSFTKKAAKFSGDINGIFCATILKQGSNQSALLNTYIITTQAVVVL